MKNQASPTMRFAAICGLILQFSAVWPIARAADQTVTGDLYIESTGPKLYFRNTGVYEWMFHANEAAFSLFDQTTLTLPFQIKSAAPDYSLFVNTNGDVGLGTSDPAQKLHLKTSSRPAMRFEQDDEAMLTRQVYDVVASDFGFFVEDITASTKPLMVQAGAPNDSIAIDPTGRVGLGTSFPAARLHGIAPAVLGPEVMAKFEVIDDSIGNLQINNASSTNGVFIPRIQGRSGSQNAGLIMEGLITNDVGVGPAIVYNARKVAGGAVATRPLVVYRNNDVAKVTVAANGNVTATAFINASSRDLKENIVDLDSRKAREALRLLNPVEFTYKDDATADPRVGFIAEDVPEIVAETDRKSVPIMDVVALVTQVVKDQQQTIEIQKAMIESQKDDIEHQNRSIDNQRKSIEDQQKKIETLMRRLTDIESRLNGR